MMLYEDINIKKSKKEITYFCLILLDKGIFLCYNISFMFLDNFVNNKFTSSN